MGKGVIGWSNHSVWMVGLRTNMTSFLLRWIALIPFEDGRSFIVDLIVCQGLTRIGANSSQRTHSTLQFNPTRKPNWISSNETKRKSTRSAKKFHCHVMLITKNSVSRCYWCCRCWRWCIFFFYSLPLYAHWAIMRVALVHFLFCLLVFFFFFFFSI